MKHTKYENKNEMEDSANVIKWLQNNIIGIKDLSIMVSMNRDGTISEIEIGKKLNNADKKKITDKFSELVGKEIG